MQGVLHKWTNMFSGWQPRWFILDSGILSYYKSLEEVSMGSKGSLKMSVCDVNVHPHDPTRLDLVIPGEQHFYVKAATPQERQLWLVALGSAKACLNNGVTPTAAGEIAPKIVRTKKSELRLYCDLLMQQVCEVRSAVDGPDTPDIKRLDEATLLLRATCDTFICTLEGCMQLANAHAAIDRSHSTDLPPSPTKLQTFRTPLTRTVSSDSHRRCVSPQSSYDSRSRTSSEPWRTIVDTPRTTPEPPDPATENHGAPANTVMARAAAHDGDAQSLPHSLFSAQPVQSFPPHPCSPSNTETPTDSTTPDDSRSLEQDVYEDAQESNNNNTNISAEHIDNFFNSLETTFADVCLNDECLITTESFLAACRCITGLFDRFNSTAFAPVKMDVSGNIRKIYQKYTTDMTGFVYLQRIVLYELSYKQHISSNSVTSALLWLKRSLEFLLEFLSLLTTTDQELSFITTQAYCSSLKPYHSWVVRGVFSLAVKAMPYRERFIESLALNPVQASLPHYEASLMGNIRAYIVPLREILAILQSFYVTHDLDLDEQV